MSICPDCETAHHHPSQAAHVHPADALARRPRREPCDRGSAVAARPFRRPRVNPRAVADCRSPRVDRRAELILVSSNPNKGIEAERILGVPLLRVSLALPEIQAATVEEITRYKLEVARTKGYSRLIVEDVSLGFDELGNFPGPYVRWLLEAAGGKGLAAIAYALNNRAAKAQCCVGYWDGTRGAHLPRRDRAARSWSSRAASGTSAGTPGSSRADRRRRSPR